MPAGAPAWLYDPEIGEQILRRIADGASLRSILLDEGMPSSRTFYKWIDASPEFAAQYARAREDQADYYADEIKDIADEEPPTIQDREGEAVGVRMDSAFVAWQRLRIDSRKWVASKLKPKSYGEKIMQQVTGADGGAIQAKVIVEFVGPVTGGVSLPVATQG